MQTILKFDYSHLATMVKREREREWNRGPRAECFKRFKFLKLLSFWKKCSSSRNNIYFKKNESFINLSSIFHKLNSGMTFIWAVWTHIARSLPPPRSICWFLGKGKHESEVMKKFSNTTTTCFGSHKPAIYLASPFPNLCILFCVICSLQPAAMIRFTR